MDCYHTTFDGSLSVFFSVFQINQKCCNNLIWSTRSFKNSSSVLGAASVIKAVHWLCGIMVLVLNIRPRLHRSALCKWMMCYSINSAHSFITCVIAIDLPWAVSGGLQLQSFTCQCDTSCHLDMPYRKEYDLPSCLLSQLLCRQIQIIAIDGKGFRLKYFACFSSDQSVVGWRGAAEYIKWNIAFVGCVVSRTEQSALDITEFHNVD